MPVTHQMSILAFEQCPTAGMNLDWTHEGQLPHAAWQRSASATRPTKPTIYKVFDCGEVSSMRDLSLAR
jgi:hypothetical protein